MTQPPMAMATRSSGAIWPGFTARMPESAAMKANEEPR